MVTSIREFNVGLYREHLEEASFLYGQRLAYLHNPEVNWPKLREWEDRFEAHVDALVIGGELALEVCQKQAAEGDSGEMHAALRVFCRQRRQEDALAVLRALDPANEEAVGAAAEALRWEIPRAWLDDLLGLPPRDTGHLTHVLARVIGFRRIASEERLRSALTLGPTFGTSDVAWALGRVGSSGSAPGLWSLLDSDDERVCEAAAIALMRLGDERPIQRAMLGGGAVAPWARRALAIGGSVGQSVRVLSIGSSRTEPMPTRCSASACWEIRGAIWPLIDLLADEGVSEAAAAALNTITGAGLYVDMFVANEFDPDELLPDDAGGLRERRDPTYPGAAGRTGTGSVAHLSTRRVGAPGWNARSPG